MKYWLFKSEPGSWSWDEQKARGEKGQEWDGVRNYQARNHMRDMESGDRGFFYHSQKGLEIVGIVEVNAPAHPDSTTDDQRWECVDIRALADMPRPVSLEEIRQNGKLSDMVLVNNTRLSVQPVDPSEWKEICRIGGLDPDTLKPL